MRSRGFIYGSFFIRWMFIVIFTAALCLGGIGCGNDDNQDGSEGSDFAVYFPHRDGSQWDYTVTNSTNESDIGEISHVSIIETQIDGPYEWQVMKFGEIEEGGSDSARNLLIRVENEGVFVKNGSGQYDNKTFWYSAPIWNWMGFSGTALFLKFPLRIGEQWDGGLKKPIEVVAQEDISTPAGKFKDCFKVAYFYRATRQYSPGVYVIEENIIHFWFAPKVGIVKALRAYTEYLEPKPPEVHFTPYTSETELQLVKYKAGGK